MKALEEVNEEHTHLSAQFESIQIDSENKFKEMEDVQQECEELEMEIARNNKLQAAKREESTELKKRHNELKDQLATVSLALQEAEAEYESFRSRIVSSPERRKRQLHDSNFELDYEKRQVKVMEEKLLDIKTKIVHVTQAIKDIPEVTDMVEEAIEAAKKQAHLEEQRDTVRTNKETILKKKAGILEDVKEAKGSLNRLEEKLVHMRKQGKVKMSAAHEAVEQANAQLLEVEQDHLEGLARVEASELEVKAMETSIELERENTREEMKAMIAEYQEMERHVLQQNAKLMAAIGVN